MNFNKKTLITMFLLLFSAVQVSVFSMEEVENLKARLFKLEGWENHLLKEASKAQQKNNETLKNLFIREVLKLQEKKSNLKEKIKEIAPRIIKEEKIKEFREKVERIKEEIKEKREEIKERIVSKLKEKEIQLLEKQIEGYLRNSSMAENYELASEFTRQARKELYLNKDLIQSDLFKYLKTKIETQEEKLIKFWFQK